MKKRNKIVFYLNGQKQEVSGDTAFLTLAEYLRYEKTLTGTKIVCAEGDCGACTVLRAFPKPGSKENLEFLAINSCVALVAQMDCSYIVTIEGIEEGKELSCCQKSIIENHASQCGYCTPGFVMASTWLLESHKEEEINEQTVKNHLTGNLCRCTGYKSIINSALDAAKTCKNQANKKSLLERFVTKKSLAELKALQKMPIEIQGKERHFFAPAEKKALCAFRKKFPQSIVLGATTDLSVQYNKEKREWTSLLSLQLIPDFYKSEVKKNRVSVGARVTLADLRKILLKQKSAVANVLDLFASPQIKNVASLAGNIANASPIADTAPWLLVLDAKVETLSKTGKKKNIPLAEFYKGYKETALAAGDIISAISFELPKKNEYFRFQKTSQRKDLDISNVNSAIWAKTDQKNVIKDIRIAFGGVSATPLRLNKLESTLKGRIFPHKNLQPIVESLHKEISPISDLRASEAYRRVLSENIFRSITRELP